MKWLLFACLALVGLVGILFLVRAQIVAALSPRPGNLGVQNGQLTPCPSTPNCVSSYATNAEHSLAPLAFTGSAGEAQAKLRAVLQQLPDVTIIQDEPGYLYAEFRTPLMRFIDDVEFHYGEGTEGVQFRSASRLGQGDGGANRQRMEKIRQLWENS